MARGRPADAGSVPQNLPMTAVAIVFWVSAGLILYLHSGYLAVLALLARLRPRPVRIPAGAPGRLPAVSVIVPAYSEQEVIAARVGNLRALDYPRDRLEVIVACEGSPDATAERARGAGADMVLQLPRGGK